MTWSRFLFTLIMALDAIRQNSTRSLLTALGIIFGVASVIAMQAIGRGGQEEIIAQIKSTGLNNIVIEQTPIVVDPNKDKSQAATDSKQTSIGLSLAEANALSQIIPHIEATSAEVEHSGFAIYSGKGQKVTLLGVTKPYFDIHNMEIESGRLFDIVSINTLEPVCIITPELKAKLFPNITALGKYLKVNATYLKVVGITAQRYVSKEGTAKADNSANMQIFAPMQTVMLRYKNQGIISQETLNSYSEKEEGDDEGASKKPNPFAQLKRIVVKVTDAQYLEPVSQLIEKYLLQKHGGAIDFTITIPELLLKQQQQAKQTFNLVLGLIAGISLLVGGIGIMNIMLVSVTERLKEIGIRRALGATQIDITAQFLTEAVLISLSGGVAGIALGIGVAWFIHNQFQILTIMTWYSILVAFAFAVVVGLVFGIAPARRAAKQDPIESLRIG